MRCSWSINAIERCSLVGSVIPVFVKSDLPAQSPTLNWWNAATTFRVAIGQKNVFLTLDDQREQQDNRGSNKEDAVYYLMDLINFTVSMLNQFLSRSCWAFRSPQRTACVAQSTEDKIVLVLVISFQLAPAFSQIRTYSQPLNFAEVTTSLMITLLIKVK